MTALTGDGGPRDVATLLAMAANLTAVQPFRLSSPLLRASATGLTAAGTTQATGLVLTRDINVVTTAATGTGVVLPNFGIGAEVLVINQGANPLTIYPFSGGSIGVVQVGPSALPLSFAGTAGAPTGNQVLTMISGTAPSLNGSGSMVFTSTEVLGLIEGIGMVPDGEYVFAVNGVTTSSQADILIRAAGTGSTNRYLLQYRWGTPSVNFVAEPGGVQGTFQNGGSMGLPSSRISVLISGSTFTAKQDGVVISSFTDTSITAAGYIGIGGISLNYSGVSYLAPSATFSLASVSAKQFVQVSATQFYSA